MFKRKAACKDCFAAMSHKGILYCVNPESALAAGYVSRHWIEVREWDHCPQFLHYIEREKMERALQKNFQLPSYERS